MNEGREAKDTSASVLQRITWEPSGRPVRLFDTFLTHHQPFGGVADSNLEDTQALGDGITRNKDAYDVGASEVCCIGSHIA
jgi:hypothetical protein